MSAPTFTLSHSFNASRDRLWQAWTDADQLAQWFGPKGYPITSCRADLQPGGLLHYGMRTPDGDEMWGKWGFREIIPPEQLVFVASFSDARAGIARHPLAEAWPLEVLTTLIFTEQDGRSSIAMQAIPIDASEVELQTFAGALDGMANGWSGTLEQLEAFLKSTT